MPRVTKKAQPIDGKLYVADMANAEERWRYADEIKLLLDPSLVEDCYVEDVPRIRATLNSPEGFDCLCESYLPRHTRKYGKALSISVPLIYKIQPKMDKGTIK